jgi:hypothetical protein
MQMQMQCSLSTSPCLRKLMLYSRSVSSSTALPQP